jgi:hypothetical protein
LRIHQAHLKLSFGGHYCSPKRSLSFHCLRLYHSSVLLASRIQRRKSPLDYHHVGRSAYIF